ncbi:hypothetical protein X941_4274 [Burkholderia pseudomallei MSHR5569]|nr:hypothetical protein X941_4274 [Burkholderia pseudomallei MSHR5569]
MNATAQIAGCRTNRTPTSTDVPWTIWTIPAGSCCAESTAQASSKTARESSVWPGCAFTTTGHPAANAEAVSPPSTENANGKLLAANIATGPMGTRILVRRGCPAGGPPETAGSSSCSKGTPASTSAAKARNWKTVRSSSPFSRVTPSCVSRSAMSTRGWRSESSALASPRRSRERAAPEEVAHDSAALALAEAAASTCSAVDSTRSVVTRDLLNLCDSPLFPLPYRDSPQGGSRCIAPGSGQSLKCYEHRRSKKRARRRVGER